MKPAAPVLTRQQLDEGRCFNPDCACGAEGSLFLHGKCHPGAGSEVEYNDGVLYFKCNECGLPIINILVAARAAPPPPPRRARRRR